jgi:excisionase family DNA binding protein
VKDVARLLALSRSKVYELVAAGELPAYRPGGRIRIPLPAVSELLERSKL